MNSKVVVHLSIHSWDKEVDGKNVRVKLPKKMKIELEISENDSLSDIHETAVDKASGETGFCINSTTLDRIDIVD